MTTERYVSYAFLRFIIWRLHMKLRRPRLLHRIFLRLLIRVVRISRPAHEYHPHFVSRATTRRPGDSRELSPPFSDMNWLAKILNLFRRSDPLPGWIPDPVDPRDARFEDIFAAVQPEALKEEIDWMPELRLRGQVHQPLCVSFAACHLQERNQRYVDPKRWLVTLSPRWLASRGGTGPRGASVRSVLEILRKEGCVQENECPFEPNLPFWKLMDVRFVSADAVLRGEANRISGWATIDPWNKNAIKQALQTGPVMFGLYIGTGWGLGGVVFPASVRPSGHLVLCTGYDKAGNFRIGDSLVPHEKLMSSLYPITSVYSVTDLPSGWKELQKEHLYDSYKNLLKDRHGKVRDFANETATAELLAKLIKPFVAKKPILGGIYGKFWIVAISAPVYSEYTLKDVMDDMNFYAENGRHLYDLNSQTKITL